MRRLVCLLIAVTALAVPATASALGTYASVSGAAKGPKGYTVTFSASTPHVGSTSSRVTLFLTFMKSGGTFGHAGYWQQQHQYSFSLPNKSLKVNKKLATARLKASLGKYGKVSVTFTQNGKLSKTRPAPHCTGPNSLSRAELETGKIRFSRPGLGRVGKLKKRAGSASRNSSNKVFKCTGGGGTPTCAVKPGYESMSGFAFAATGGSLSANAQRVKAGAPVAESVSTSANLTAPGTFESHYITVIGAASVLSHTTGSPAVVTLTGAGHGITGSFTATGTLTTNTGGSPCTAFMVDSVFPLAPGGTLTAAFDTGTAKLDTTAPGVTVFGSWSLYHH